MTQVDATLLIGALAALIAIWGVLTQRQIARRRATLDYIAASKSNRAMIDARREFIELAKAPGSLAAWADKDKEKTSQAQVIGEVLNQYELISIGIQNRILDYNIYKQLSRLTTIKFWERGHPYVAALRNRLPNEDKDVVYKEFEKMVRWLKENKKPDNWWWGNFF